MFYQFYNTRTGTAMLEYTSKGTAAFSFARSLNPSISPNQITKGMQIYDYKNIQYFSLTLDEALLVAYLLETKATVKLGSIVSEVKQYQPTQENPNPSKFYEILVTHFPGTKEQKMQGMKSYSKLSIKLYDNNSGSISLFKDNFSCTVPFGVEGYFILVSFLKSLPTFIATLEAVQTGEQIKQRKEQENSNLQSNYMQNNYVPQDNYQQQYKVPNTGYNNSRRNVSQKNNRPYSQPVTDVQLNTPLYQEPVIQTQYVQHNNQQNHSLTLPPLDNTSDLLPTRSKDENETSSEVRRSIDFGM